MQRSRRLVEARGSGSPEEGRAYLQSRLRVFSKLMFWAFIALLLFLAAMYGMYPEISPAQNDLIFVGAAVGLFAMAMIWLAILARKTLGVDALYWIDLVYAIFIGLAFGGSAWFASDFRPAGYASVIYASFTVFTRAIVVPSSGRRTAVISTVVFVPVLAAGIGLALTTRQDVPAPAFVIGGFLFASVGILLASVGSSTIYGLREQVKEAMQLGQYTLDRKIGEGGMGTVYRAHHAMLRRPTALKLMNIDRVGADNMDRFEREVQSMSELTHPNTVAVYDYGRSPDGLLYYAMEYLDGIDLEQLVKDDGAQPPARVARILAQVAGALEEAHARKLVHRDVKPANIIVCERGGVHDVAKVVDFGLVNEIGKTDEAEKQSIMGTPAYLAPEAITDPSTVGPAADLYGLGAVGYFLLAGKRMFDGDKSVVTAKHLAETPAPLEHVPEPLASIIMRCVEKKAADRFPSAAALAQALSAIPPWPDDEASEWWKKFRAKRRVIEVQSAAVTITLDVVARRQ